MYTYKYLNEYEYQQYLHKQHLEASANASAAIGDIFTSIFGGGGPPHPAIKAYNECVGKYDENSEKLGHFYMLTSVMLMFHDAAHMMRAKLNVDKNYLDARQEAIRQLASCDDLQGTLHRLAGRQYLTHFSHRQSDNTVAEIYHHLAKNYTYAEGILFSARRYDTSGVLFYHTCNYTIHATMEPFGENLADVSTTIKLVEHAFDMENRWNTQNGPIKRSMDSCVYSKIRKLLNVHHKRNPEFVAAYKAAGIEPEEFAQLLFIYFRAKQFIDIENWDGVCSLYRKLFGEEKRSQLSAFSFSSEYIASMRNKILENSPELDYMFYDPNDETKPRSIANFIENYTMLKNTLQPHMDVIRDIKAGN
jgi:hypothetical protein